MEQVKKRVAAIMERFPSEEAVFSRPGKDSFGQPTDATEIVGVVRVWRVAPERPESWKAAQAGQLYEDQKAIWVATPYSETLPDVQRGDTCSLGDGMLRHVRNIQNRGNVRVFWQLSEV